MALVDAVYAAAARAGLLATCAWQPASGAPAQSHPVGFSCPDESLLDGLAVSTEYAMTFPASAFIGLAPGEQVSIGADDYLVREVRALADGSERRARLSRL